MGVAPRRTRAQGCGLLAARHNWPGVTSGRRRQQTEKSLDAPAPAINRTRMAQGKVKLTQQTRRSVWSQGRAGPPSGPKSKEEERVWLAACGDGMSVTGLSRSHVGKSCRALEATANQSTRHWKFAEPLCTRGWVTGNQGEEGVCPQGIYLLVVKQLIGHKARQTDPWNRKESPEMNAHGGEMIFIMTAKTIQWRNSIFF